MYRRLTCAFRQPSVRAHAEPEHQVLHTIWVIAPDDGHVLRSHTSPCKPHVNMYEECILQGVVPIYSHLIVCGLVPQLVVVYHCPRPQSVQASARALAAERAAVRNLQGRHSPSSRLVLSVFFQRWT